MDKKKRDSKTLEEALRSVLQIRESSTQENICHILEKQGFDVNQSKISRLLRKIGATKTHNVAGQIVYSLPREPAPPSIHTPLRNLVVDIVCNEMLIIIFTSPGSASMIARMLDHLQFSTHILGTIAGDDTIFVAPKSVKEIKNVYFLIKNFLFG